MANTNSNLIANPAKFIPVMNQIGTDYARVRIAQDNFEVTDGDLNANDTIQLVRLPVIARPLSILLTGDDLGTALSVHVGIYDVDLVEKDLDAFTRATPIGFSSALRLTEALGNDNDTVTKALIGDALWEWAGDSTQPDRGTEYDIVLTVAASISPSAGTIGFQVKWAVD